MLEQYELRIETPTESGRDSIELYTLEARSETEAYNLARQYKTQYNLVTISRISGVSASD
jgi:hypothetical protein